MHKISLFAHDILLYLTDPIDSLSESTEFYNYMALSLDTKLILTKVWVPLPGFDYTGRFFL